MFISVEVEKELGSSAGESPTERAPMKFRVVMDDVDSRVRFDLLQLLVTRRWTWG